MFEVCLRAEFGTSPQTREAKPLETLLVHVRVRATRSAMRSSCFPNVAKEPKTLKNILQFATKILRSWYYVCSKAKRNNRMIGKIQQSVGFPVACW